MKTKGAMIVMTMKDATLALGPTQAQASKIESDESLVCELECVLVSSGSSSQYVPVFASLSKLDGCGGWGFLVVFDLTSEEDAEEGGSSIM